MTKERDNDEYTVCDQCRAKKIRCGREKPSCGNCSRIGLQCDWSGQGKKCNQTALLSHTMLGLGSRLQYLETSILDTQKSLKRILEEPSAILPAPGRHQAYRSRHTIESSSRWSPERSGKGSPESLAKPGFTRTLGRFHKDNNNSERYFGSTSLDSLMLDMKDVITESLDFETQTLRECVLQAQRKIDLLVGQGDDELIKDRSPPTAPPFAILDAMIEPYFATINHHVPFWIRERFIRMATALRKSTSSEQDLASIICCNNLILMALSANLLCSHREESIQTNQTRKTSSFDLDVIAGFLNNAKRAIKNIDQIVSPRLVNVQALLSLYVVAQEHLSTGLSETLLALAARCAKSIGIHQWHTLQDQLSDEDVKERRNISYCIYILDKTVCWTAGSSPSVPISDVHVDSSLRSSADSVTSYLVAKAELATIEESIYLGIYAIQAKARTEEQVRQFATTTLSKLQDWLTDSRIDLNDIQEAPVSSPPKVRLAISFLCAKLLLVWPNKRHPDVLFQQSQEVARICMRLLLRLWRSPPDQEHHTVFPFFLASLPPLYLHEISTSVLCGQEIKSDMDMLQYFTEMLQIVTNCRGEKSYNRRLYQMTLIAIDVINTRKIQHKRRKSNCGGPAIGQSSQPDHASLYSSLSDLLSPPTSRSGEMNVNVREAEGQGFDMFQDPENFMRTINSANGESSWSSDEFSPHMGSYAKAVPENLNSLAYNLGLFQDDGVGGS